jgi:hypothetical protein
MRARAAAEAMEEGGVHIDSSAVFFLGAPVFPTVGLFAERFFFCAAEVTDLALAPPPGDGSPFEEGSRVYWLPLETALERCRSGQICDLKTELILRRLEERLVQEK